MTSSRKHVALVEAINSLLSDDNVCSEQTMVILPPVQWDRYATNSEQGKDDVRSSLETFPNDVAGLAKVWGDSPGKEYVAFQASNSVDSPAEKKKQQPIPKTPDW